VDHNGYRETVSVPGSMREEWLEDLRHGSPMAAG
jgi:hypothetical protein